MQTSSLVRKSKSVLAWLWEPRAFYYALVPVALAFCAISLFDSAEPAIRLSGLALQILGIATVIWGITTTREHFGHPSIVSVVLRWLKRFPLIKRHAILQPEGISVGMSLVGGRLTSIYTPTPNAPVSDRLSNIEGGLEILQNRLDGAENQLDAQRSELEGKIKAESHTRASEDHKVLKSIESSSTGGLHISAIGALWLFVGVVLSTASPEIARSLQ
jgi:hypothetical protein